MPPPAFRMNVKKDRQVAAVGVLDCAISLQIDIFYDNIITFAQQLV